MGQGSHAVSRIPQLRLRTGGQGAYSTLFQPHVQPKAWFALEAGNSHISVYPYGSFTCVSPLRAVNPPARAISWIRHQHSPRLKRNSRRCQSNVHYIHFLCRRTATLCIRAQGRRVHGSIMRRTTLNPRASSQHQQWQLASGSRLRHAEAKTSEGIATLPACTNVPTAAHDSSAEARRPRCRSSRPFA